MTKIETGAPELQPKPTSHEFQPHDWVRIGAAGDSEALGLPSGIMGQQVVAKISVGQPLELVGETQAQPPQAIYLLKVTDRDNREYKGLLERAQSAGQEQAADASYMVAATGSRAHYRESIAGIAFLPELIKGGSIKDDPIARVVIGRSGSAKWLGFHDPGHEEDGWTPFAGNQTVSPFMVVASDKGSKVDIINLAASNQSRMEVQAPDLEVMYQNSAPKPVETGSARKRSRALKAAKLISRIGLTPRS